MAGRGGRAPNGRDVQLREMELLLRIGKEVGAIESLEELLRTIVEITTKETGAERGTLFLNDEHTGELYSRVMQGGYVREIRILNTAGTAGLVFTKGKGVIVNRPYEDPHFDRTVDRETGYVTKNICAAPIQTGRGQIIGVLQMINKTRGNFTSEDLRRLTAMAEQTSIALRSAQFVERMQVSRDREMQLLEMVAEITADFNLDSVLRRIVSETAAMLQADRATLFLHDEKTDELFSRIAMGESVGEIRIPSDRGIAGAVFTSGKAINIPYAYADLRFNPALDKSTGYFTRSILCVPITGRSGKTIGVTEVMNKAGGPFTREDEARLKAFTAQVAISLQNAKLFDDVQNMKNYNESMLESMSNGVVTLDGEGRIVTCNLAATIILRTPRDEMLRCSAHEFFAGPNSWILERVEMVKTTQLPDYSVDAQLTVPGGSNSINLSVLPLVYHDKGGESGGSLLMIEDISAEKRMKSTMSRYMDPALTSQLLAEGADVLGGRSVTATVLFSDIRRFTEISEELGPHPTVSLLNEYFTIMVDCIQAQGGMLDKFIGDAVMAVFGLPVSHEDDEDRAVRCAISMITELWRWNVERVASGKAPLDIGIGVNTDTVVSGNIGAPKRMDFTIIGDGVNLASRIESACKQYSAHILVSESTCKKLRGTYRLREVDRVVVKGRHVPVGIFEVLDYHTPETFSNLLEAVQFFKSGVSYYREGHWDKAMVAFGQAAALNPKDQLPNVYIERCLHLKENPPASDWNGVWVLKTK